MFDLLRHDTGIVRSIKFCKVNSTVNSYRRSWWLCLLWFKGLFRQQHLNQSIQGQTTHIDKQLHLVTEHTSTKPFLCTRIIYYTCTL